MITWRRGVEAARWSRSVRAAREGRGLLALEYPPTGRFKARFFQGAGFTTTESLVAALEQVARSGTVTPEVQTGYGVKYVVDGQLETPAGDHAAIRTVWIREEGSVAPQFVTAYPRQGE